MSGSIITRAIKLGRGSFILVQAVLLLTIPLLFMSACSEDHSADLSSEKIVMPLFFQDHDEQTAPGSPMILEPTPKRQANSTTQSQPDQYQTQTGNKTGPGLNFLVDFKANSYSELKVVLKVKSTAPPDVSPALAKSIQQHKNEKNRQPMFIAFEQRDEIIFSWRLRDEKLFHPEKTIRRSFSRNGTNKTAVEISLLTSPYWQGQVAEIRAEIFCPETSSGYEITKLEFIPLNNSIFKNARGMRFRSGVQQVIVVSMPSTHIVRTRLTSDSFLGIGCGLLRGSSAIWSGSVLFSVVLKERKQDAEIPLFQKSLQTKKPGEQDCLTTEINLQQWADQDVTLIFKVEPELTSMTITPDIYAVWTQPFLFNRSLLRRKPLPNILVISLDTLRPDILGCYGSPDGLTPNIDRFSRHSSLFAEAISQAPSTTSSHGSLFTSRYPFQLGFHAGRGKLENSNLTLATILMRQGWFTGAVTGGAKMAAFTGLDQGFYSYSTRDPSGTAVKNYVLPWLEQHAHKPFFFFYHTYHIHAPYRFNPAITAHIFPEYKGSITGSETIENPRLTNISRTDKQYLWTLYKTGLREMDTYLGQLFSFLVKHQLAASTLLIILSDHGEQFGEFDDLFGHCNSLFDTLLKVPVLIKFPDQKPRSAIFLSPITLLDVTPTILDYLHIDKSNQMQGLSVLPLLHASDAVTPFAFSEMSWRILC
ncbi:sulfatase [candidate division CSSED10-310 bacterium]|uniref:Sulfatase n=1 Tax=candidate division CSSED10-310 bacterium TaxID=2855610 RepID=A0ABV6Z3D5_UNCC1